MAFKGTHNVQKRGSKVWHQRLKVSPGQKVAAGALLVMNAKSLKAGENAYAASNNIHTRVSGTVEIKNKRISVRPLPAGKK
ncbi:hypothetical protein ACFL1D_03115 [Candidatus Omnitrophota bacterium]